MKTKLFALLLGSVFVLSACGGEDAPADEAADTTEGTTETASGDAEEIYQKSCIGCHGRELEGGAGPKLTEVGAKYSQDEIASIIINGQGGMPKGILNEADAEVVAAWLAEKK